jgi:hypothetical protein
LFAARPRGGLEMFAGQTERGFGFRAGHDTRCHDFAPGRVDHAEHECFADESGREQRLFDASRYATEAGVAIYNALARRGRITMYVDALAASAASVVAMAGDRVIMAGNAMLMIHQAWTIAAGNATELAKVAVAARNAAPHIVTTIFGVERQYKPVDLVFKSNQII